MWSAGVRQDDDAACSSSLSLPYLLGLSGAGDTRTPMMINVSLNAIRSSATTCLSLGTWGFRRWELPEPGYPQPSPGHWAGSRF